MNADATPPAPAADGAGRKLARRGAYLLAGLVGARGRRARGAAAPAAGARALPAGDRAVVGPRHRPAGRDRDRRCPLARLDAGVSNQGRAARRRRDPGRHFGGRFDPACRSHLLDRSARPAPLGRLPPAGDRRQRRVVRRDAAVRRNVRGRRARPRAGRDRRTAYERPSRAVDAGPGGSVAVRVAHRLDRRAARAWSAAARRRDAASRTYGRPAPDLRLLRAIRRRPDRLRDRNDGRSGHLVVDGHGLPGRPERRSRPTRPRCRTTGVDGARRCRLRPGVEHLGRWPPRRGDGNDPCAIAGRGPHGKPARRRRGERFVHGRAHPGGLGAGRAGSRRRHFRRIMARLGHRRGVEAAARRPRRCGDRQRGIRAHRGSRRARRAARRAGGERDAERPGRRRPARDPRGPPRLGAGDRSHRARAFPCQRPVHRSRHRYGGRAGLGRRGERSVRGERAGGGRRRCRRPSSRARSGPA